MGRYTRVSLLGEGGFGEVWKAKDSDLDRWVALKILKSPDPEERARFRREAQMAAKLNHPHIAAVYEATDEHIAMQFIDGRTLESAGRDDPRRIVSLLRDAARAVHAAHEQGIVHRDLKPANLMVERDHVYVLDFGLAKSMTVDSSFSASGLIVGTPSYMSPEQARGERADARSDVYSLGATLYDLLAGRPPFRSDNVFKLLKKIAEDEPATLPGELGTIAMKCLEKDRSRRYPSATHLAEDLDRWLRGEPVEARGPSTLYRIRKRLARNPWASGLGIATAALVLVAGVVALVNWKLRKQVTELQLSREAQDALRAADEALTAWTYERYVPEHDVTPFRRRLEAAIASLRRVLEIEPGAHPVWAKLGWAELELGRARAALEALERAVSLAPGEGLYRWRLGRAHQAIQRELQALAAGTEEDSERERLLEEAREHGRRADLEIERAAASAWSGEEGERGLVEAYRLRGRGDGGNARRVCVEVAARGGRGAEQAWMLAGDLASDAAEKLSFYEKAARHAPSWAEPRVSCAQQRARLEDYSTAEEDADAAIRIDPLWPIGWLTRGQARTNRAYRESRGDPSGGYRSAIEDYARTLELSPDSALAYKGRAVARLNCGTWRMDRGGDPSIEFRAALEEDLPRAARLAPLDAEVPMYRGRIRTQWADHRLRSGEDPTESYRRALEEDFAQALAIRPRYPEVWNRRGETKVNWGSYLSSRGLDPTELYRQAVDVEFAKALELRPDWPTARANRANARINWGAWEFNQRRDPSTHFRAAIEDLDPAILAAPDPAHFRRTRAKARLNWGIAELGAKRDPTSQFELALEDLDAAIAASAEFAGAWFDRAHLRIQWTRWLLANRRDPRDLFHRAIEEDYARGLELDPGSAEAWARCGWARTGYMIELRRTRKEEDGKNADEQERLLFENFERAIRIDPRYADAYRYRGIAWSAIGRWREALQDFEQAVAIRPSLGALLGPAIEECRKRIR